MNFDSQKFFIGMMNFFSILLPGALLTWLLMGVVGPVVLGGRCPFAARWTPLSPFELWKTNRSGS